MNNLAEQFEKAYEAKGDERLALEDELRKLPPKQALQAAIDCFNEFGNYERILLAENVFAFSNNKLAVVEALDEAAKAGEDVLEYLIDLIIDFSYDEALRPQIFHLIDSIKRHPDRNVRTALFEKAMYLVDDYKW